MRLTSSDRLKEHYKVLIVGGGPAGLAASNALRGREEDVLVVDLGSRLEHRCHNEQQRLTTGLGGAGLYSDGKFSFYPSATALWNLDGPDVLRDASSWLERILGRYEIPRSPLANLSSAAPLQSPGAWNFKEYPSMGLPLSAREDLIEKLIRSGAGTAVHDTVVKARSFDSIEKRFRVTLARVDPGHMLEVSTDFLIFATGRMGPIELVQLDFIQPVFKRLEVGFRIEQKASSAFFRDFPQLDPKFSLEDKDRGVEWRTFCACRDGETVYTNTAGLWSVSGRSDCAPSGRSNIGFNTRITDGKLAERVWPTLRSNLQHLEGPFRMPLVELLREKEKSTLAHTILGREITDLALYGLDLFVKKFPTLNSEDCQLVGPSLEGVGWYPKVNNDLSIPGVPACVAGDACGLFRGLSGALISGYFCGLKYQQEDFVRPCRDGINLSRVAERANGFNNQFLKGTFKTAASR